MDPLTMSIIVALVVAGALYFHHATKDFGVYRDRLYEPIQLADRPPKTVAFFERHTREMEQLGFEIIGDYILARKPWNMSRLFTSPDSRVFGDINECFGILSDSFTSIFSDGTGIESSSANLIRIRWLGKLVRFGYHEDKALKFNHLPDASIAALYQSHLEVSQRYCEKHDCEMLAFGPDQFRDVFSHSHRLSNWDSYHEGLIPEPPPSLSETDDAPFEVPTH